MKMSTIFITKTMRSFLIKIHWFFSSQIGVDLCVFFMALRGIPIYFRDLVVFKRRYRGEMKIMPCLHDRYAEGGITKSEYFWQDLFVARAIHDANPRKHVDIGSRVDGFVAHVASYRECEVFDFRPISSYVPGVLFCQADLMNPLTVTTNGLEDYCDSISCLHALEHFGLGRYGDEIDVDGYRKGLKNMALLLELGGTLYLSTPIGKERVEFNANWIFDPRSIISCGRESSLVLQRLILITPDRGAEESGFDSVSLEELSKKDYSLAIFIFKKIAS